MIHASFFPATICANVQHRFACKCRALPWGLSVRTLMFPLPAPDCSTAGQLGLFHIDATTVTCISSECCGPCVKGMPLQCCKAVCVRQTCRPSFDACARSMHPRPSSSLQTKRRRDVAVLRRGPWKRRARGRTTWGGRLRRGTLAAMGRVRMASCRGPRPAARTSPWGRGTTAA